VKSACEHLGWEVAIEHSHNPRKEAEDHYYNAQHSKLIELGLQPRLLNEELIDTMLEKIRAHRDRIDPTTLVQDVRWIPKALEDVAAAVGAQPR
jgi:UDP-sulfoquinovose synthase